MALRKDETCERKKRERFRREGGGIREGLKMLDVVKVLLGKWFW